MKEINLPQADTLEPVATLRELECHGIRIKILPDGIICFESVDSEKPLRVMSPDNFTVNCPNVRVEGVNININGTYVFSTINGDANVEVEGNVNLQTTGTINLESDADINITSGGTVNVN